jgi:prophage DNA circulation protein
LKKLVGNTEIEDALQDLDKLTQEEVRIASAELLKLAHGTDGKVMGVDDRVRDVDARVQVVGGDVQDVRRKVRGVNDRVRGIGNSLRHMINKVQGVDDKLDQVNRSSSPNFPPLRNTQTPHRAPTSRESASMAFASRSLHHPQHRMQCSSQRYGSMVLTR